MIAARRENTRRFHTLVCSMRLVTRCRDIGALKQWTLRQANNDAFKAYRKEYKRRFAWIKAGRITDQQFYDWSERARAEKDKCKREEISRDAFFEWLKKQ